MSEQIKLRDLPGVRSIFELCLNQRNFDYPESSYSRQKIDAVSIGLFGITEYDTFWEDGDEWEDEKGEPLNRHEYDQHFIVTDLRWDKAKVFWDAIGWDVSDGAGNELNCAHFFMRQIIATVKELVEGSKLTLDGSGEYGLDDDGNAVDDTQRWANAIERQAERFLLGNRVE